MKSVSLVIRPQKGYLLWKNGLTTVGVKIAIDPYFNLEEGTSMHVLYESIQQAFNSEAKVVPHPSDWKANAKEFAEKLKVKSINKDVDSVNNKFVAISELENTIIFRSYRPASKPDKGFVHNKGDFDVSIPSGSNENEFIAALNSAIEHCG